MPGLYALTRIQEEVADRSRKPTKICVEHHLYQRGSKSQTFVLPTAASSLRSHTPFSPPTGHFDKQRQSLDMPKQQRQSDEPLSGNPEDNVGLISSAATLVELALIPFDSYRRRGPTGGRAKDGGNPANELPPVVKLNVSLLGFEKVDMAGPVAVPPGQRTLRDMRWLGRGCASDSNYQVLHEHGTSNRRSQPSVGGVLGEQRAATALVVCSPIASVPQSLSASPLDDPGRQTGTKRDGHEDDVRDREPHVAEGNNILVRCPKCKACLSLGEAWDRHRKEHVALGVKRDKTGVHRCSNNPFPTTSLSPTAFPSPKRKTSSPHSARKSRQIRPQQRQPLPRWEDSFDSDGRREHDITLNRGKRRQSGESVGDKRSKQAGEYASQSDGAGDRNEKPARLSDLLPLAVTPAQAADVLRRRGWLRPDEQTRFAHLRLGRGMQEALHE